MADGMLHITQKKVLAREELKKFIENCKVIEVTQITQNQLMYFLEKHANELVPILKEFK